LWNSSSVPFPQRTPLVLISQEQPQFHWLSTGVSSNNYNCVTSWNSFENIPFSVLFLNETMIISFLLLLSHGMHFLWRVSSWSSINFSSTHRTICHCLDSLNNKFQFLCDEVMNCSFMEQLESHFAVDCCLLGRTPVTCHIVLCSVAPHM
jgi:hypothetical protein